MMGIETERDIVHLVKNTVFTYENPVPEFPVDRCEPPFSDQLNPQQDPPGDVLVLPLADR